MLGYHIFSNVFLELFLSLCQTRKIWLPCFNFLSQQELPFQFNFFALHVRVVCLKRYSSSWRLMRKAVNLVIFFKSLKINLRKMEIIMMKHLRCNCHPSPSFTYKRLLFVVLQSTASSQWPPTPAARSA
jgi:hypothetical protein